MKKSTKCTILIFVTLLAMVLIGCGRGGSSRSDITANTSGGTTDSSDDVFSDTDMETEEDASEDSYTDQQNVWEASDTAIIEGQTVSYGPVTITLPEEYVVDDEYSSAPVFWATDSTEAGYTPNISFKMNPAGMISSDESANEEGYLSGMETAASQTDGLEVEEIVSYEETELGGYKAVRTLVKAAYNGLPLVMSSYSIYEKVDSIAKVVIITYYGVESDTERLSAFESSLDTISLRTDTGESGSSNGSELASDWQSIYDHKVESTGSPLSIDGNSVTYGPLQMNLPDGYTVEDETAESPNFFASDGSAFNIMLTEDSYQLISDQEYVENSFREEIESNGMTDVSVNYYESISVNGYNGYDIGIVYTNNGVKMIEYVRALFEATDETESPVLMVIWAGSEETARNTGDEVDAAFESIRLVSE